MCGQHLDGTHSFQKKVYALILQNQETNGKKHTIISQNMQNAFVRIMAGNIKKH
jgi:outer membrane lipopolysaccharide assembly protein LptE/RlpB